MGTKDQITLDRHANCHHSLYKTTILTKLMHAMKLMSLTSAQVDPSNIGSGVDWENQCAPDHFLNGQSNISFVYHIKLELKVCSGLDHIFIGLGPAPATPPSLSGFPARMCVGTLPRWEPMWQYPIIITHIQVHITFIVPNLIDKVPSLAKEAWWLEWPCA